MTNTATSANMKPILFTEQKTKSITFKEKEHEKFYSLYLSKCRTQDVYHKALIYCLGISADTRNNVNHIFNIKPDCINPDCLYEGWITSGAQKSCGWRLTY